jgi:hypothetical protein
MSTTSGPANVESRQFLELGEFAFPADKKGHGEMRFGEVEWVGPRRREARVG